VRPFEPEHTFDIVVEQTLKMLQQQLMHKLDIVIVV
jgi:hypothetical protein